MIKISLILFVSFICFSTINCENIPVFLHGSESNAYSPALKLYESIDFANLINSLLEESTVTVVFSENTLSVENFSSCKNSDGTTCFKNLESKTSKTYLPFVSDPMQTLKNVAEYKKQETAQINTDGTLSPVNVEPGSFLFITLNDYNLGEDEIDIFSRHDKFMENIVAELSEKLNVLAIYTGKHSPLSKTHSRQERQALVPVADEETDVPSNATYFSIDNGRALIIFKKIARIDKGVETTIEMISAKITEDKETTMTIELTGDATLGINVEDSRGNWNVIGLTWNKEKLIVRNPISVSHGFSYHCAQETEYYSDKKGLTIMIEGIQFQPIFMNDTKISSFGDSWDCIGFTSGGIWAGLFVTFILLFILSIGLSWIMDIKTMDKFDDPKGKTITVNVTD